MIGLVMVFDVEEHGRLVDDDGFVLFDMLVESLPHLEVNDDCG